MTANPHHREALVALYRGDVRAVLSELPSASAHAVVTSPPYWGLRSYLQERHPDKPLELGSERTVSEYVSSLVEVFREARRVLRPDGTVWLNLGDSYIRKARGMPGGRDTPCAAQSSRRRNIDLRVNPWNAPNTGDQPGLKPKDLVGVPWRVALALQDDGWCLRSEVIWHKRAPTPESVYDRPCRDHEHVFLLSQRERYFYDAEAIKEPVTGNAHHRGAGIHPKAARADRERDGAQNASRSAAVAGRVETRNRRTVWTLGPEPLDEEHYAAFPTRLVEPMILASTSAAGCCAACGAQIERIVERVRCLDGEPWLDAPAMRNAGVARQRAPSSAQGVSNSRISTRTQTTGWRRTCACDAGVAPSVVLDPFVGSGTTALVGRRLGRAVVGVDIDERALDIAVRRLGGQQPVTWLEPVSEAAS